MPGHTWAPPAPNDHARTLQVLRLGRSDPTCRGARRDVVAYV
ncbi:hypothetical protein [Streptomyces pakalii]|uniref:Uncharacterized protein n=1 Tax=Streptomyces pakalii TaxID=3036494 RepID=A0ABT7D2J5_9ACTN|nr:hypothetical protein [Streptomyces pakalii]MDJ1640014.1 hypothetical protein [Streptomyces pakalii]